MKKIIRLSIVIALAAAAYSAVPLVMLYTQGDPATYTNAQAADKLRSNKGDHFEFIVLSDTHAGLVFCDSAALKEMRGINREGRFKKVPIDFAFITGDITFRGYPRDYAVFNRLRSMIRMPVISAMGNHDDDQDDGSLYRKYAGQGDIAFADRNAYFIVIDCIANEFTDARFAWFEEELKKSSAYAHRFIVIHKSPVSPYFQSWYRPETTSWSYRFMKLCEKYKVDMVFSGHEHMFKETAMGGVKYIVTGGGGMPQNIPDSDGGYLHYTVVRVYGDYVDYEVRKVFPPAWEYFIFYMWKDIFYFLKNALS